MTVAFTGGGTAGHINPGLAVAEALVSQLPCRVVWLGNCEGMDRALVERVGIEFIGISSGKFRRELSFRNFTDLFRIAKGWIEARQALKRLKPALLFSKGGYVSVPPCAAAHGLGIPVFTHESDATPGLATRLNARRSEMIFTAYAGTASFFGPSLMSRVEVTGNPIRSAIASGDASRGRSWLGFDGKRPIILFVGGSQGARQINDIASTCVRELSSSCDIVHQTGMIDDLPSARPAYRPFPYIHEELPDVMAACDLVVARAGAGFIWELGSLGKPMVLVPLSSGATRGDQVQNARIFAASGAAVSLEGAEASPEAVTKVVRDLLSDRERLSSMSAAGKALCPSDAAQRIARRIVERLEKRDGGARG